MKTNKNGWHARICAALVVVSGAAGAQAAGLDGALPPEPARWYVQAGAGQESAAAVGVGVTLPWRDRQWQLGGGVVRGHWDLAATGWSIRADAGSAAVRRRELGVLTAGLGLRWRGDEGRSPWFWEAGTGLSLASGHFVRSGERAGSRFNFATHIGGGYLFGSHGEHEISLRLQHTSNAGIKEPNPGANFLLLRYAHGF